MEIFNFNFPIFVKDLKLDNDYINIVKNKSLKTYEFNKNNYFEENDTDFSFKTNEQIKNYLIEIIKELNCKECRIENTWIQKYNNNNFHDCHVHHTRGFSFILYIDCTKDSSETLFYNVGYPYVSTKTYRVKPKIGRCVVFHGAIPHTALPNKDKKRLIVSGNIFFN
jgi:hypothetical protein